MSRLDLSREMILENEKSNLKVTLDRFMVDCRRHWRKAGISEHEMHQWATEWLKDREARTLMETQAELARIEAQSYQSSEQLGFSFA